MARFTIQLFENERAALVELAERERRDPRAQAALLIRKALELDGLIPAQPRQSHHTRIRVPHQAAPRVEA